MTAIDRKIQRIGTPDMQQQNGLLPEIQGLRAVAVGLVLIFHIWPSALTGGYVGVDVFFVISGYLITGLLVRAAMRDGHISLIDFYSRRARRLLPAATAVLAATFAGMFIFLPEARFEETAIQIAASALYIQNWVLAWLSVDYLGAENAASPVQHYWSLSIEEQFYFVWPLVMIGALYCARRLGGSPGRIFIVALSLIFTASLAASAFLTAQDPARAYFVTHTRMWELALGGLLALTVHHLHVPKGWPRAAALVAGLTAIIWSAIAYSPATPFPGAAALVPTLGTALAIVAGDVRLGFFRGLNARWLTYIGDRSYSIYLWHWPIVVFYTVRHETVGLMDGIGLITLTLLLSHISYKQIEQRYRHAGAKGDWKPIVYGLVSIAACVFSASIVQYSAARQSSIQISADNPLYPGPSALLASVPVPDGVKPLPALAALKRDLPLVYTEKCHQNQKSSEPISCLLGDLHGSKTIAVVGDSHAAQWIPALEKMAKELGWKLMTFTKSACPFSRVAVKAAGGIPYPSCSEWRENVILKIKETAPILVFTSQSRGYGYINRETMTAGLRNVWRELEEAGTQVVVIQDTPWMTFEPGDCLAAGDPQKCTSVRTEVEADDLLSKAAEGAEGVQFVDMTDGICRAEFCDAVVGNIIVWRDRHHLSATYSQALGPYMARLAGLTVRNRSPMTAATASAEARHNIAARLVCDALPGSQSFERKLLLEVENGTIAYRRGDWKKKKKHYDLWSGTVDRDQITVMGHYIEGAGGVKKVSFSGHISDGRLVLKGARGPRKCSVSAPWPARSAT